MLNFSTDQWIIVLLVFVLGLLVGGFIFSGGGRKWKQRYNNEVDRRTELERVHAERERNGANGIPFVPLRSRATGTMTTS